MTVLSYEQKELDFIEMAKIEGWIMEMPYDAFTYADSWEKCGPLADIVGAGERYKAFREYRIDGWVNKNTQKLDKHVFEMRIKEIFKSIEGDKEVEQWLLDNIKSLRYIYDFSGIGFGFQIWERDDEVSFSYQHEKYHDVIPREEFYQMSVIDRLEYLKEKCEFVPFRILWESFSDWDESHKFKKIKLQEDEMKKLKPYLDELKYPPRDDVFYYIRFSDKWGWHLVRDTYRSPKNV